MSAVGGDITEITYNHPTLGTGTIYPKAKEDSTLNLGGFRSEDDENGVDGSGRTIDKMNRVRWSAECVIGWDNNVAKELEAIVAMAESPVEADWTVTHVSGQVYGGTGKPVGNLDGAMGAATFSLKIAGGGKMRAQL